eukprot:CAMPEP_0173439206 /NCGR_PEP_ID=MMETSP1357-20121228/20827_1 /TAXON_ID=77926 /ORGANISM="Hemiselmis rufescens, Strain PCC563" /LENGTH=258 /DNA_ID=CAMNT_0014404555 /DNA_START=39 /DNA_END=813 /DNA_ORIENTATION=-
MDRHGGAARFLPFDMQPLHHCCLGCIDIEVGYRFMCLLFFAYGVLGIVAACADLGGGEDVWRDFGEYNSKGLAFSRLVLHSLFTANQVIGLKAHWNRDARRADWYFWGWVGYVAVSFFVEVHHLSSIGSDSKWYGEALCAKCEAMFHNVTSGCEDERVSACVEMDGHSPYFASYAYFSGGVWLAVDVGVNCYFAVVARSYWFHLYDDKMIILGQSEMGPLGHSAADSGLTPLEEQALGGDTNVYVRMQATAWTGAHNP